MHSCLIIRYKPSNTYEVLRYLSANTMNHDRNRVDQLIKEYRKQYFDDHIMILEDKEDYYRDLYYDFVEEKWLKSEID